MSSYLRNDHIRLRALEVETDTPLLYQWENDTEAWESSGMLNPIPKAYLQDFIIASTKSVIETGQLLLMIEESLNGQTVGHVQLLDFDLIHQRAELGIYIAPEYRRLGYASMAIGLLLSYAEDKLRCSHFYTRIIETNIASIALFEGLGFALTATLPHWHWDGQAYRSLHFYQLWK